MKTRNIIAATASTLALTASIAYGEHHEALKVTYETDGSIHRITQDTLDRQVTAKDFIGATVYDSAGEKIGDIVDIATNQLVGKDMSNKMAKQGANKDQNENMKDHMKDTKSSLASKSPTVFISVGGLWGIGDDIVAVSADRLSYDQSEKRFALNTSKKEVMALAEKEPMKDNNRDADDEQYSAKYKADADVNIIREALRDVKGLMADEEITVLSQNDEIVLYGTVPTEEAKKRAEDIASRLTEKDVKNSLKIKKN